VIVPNPSNKTTYKKQNYEYMYETVKIQTDTLASVIESEGFHVTRIRTVFCTVVIFC